MSIIKTAEEILKEVDESIQKAADSIKNASKKPDHIDYDAIEKDLDALLESSPEKNAAEKKEDKPEEDKPEEDKKKPEKKKSGDKEKPKEGVEKEATWREKVAQCYAVPEGFTLTDATKENIKKVYETIDMDKIAKLSPLHYLGLGAAGGGGLVGSGMYALKRRKRQASEQDALRAGYQVGANHILAALQQAAQRQAMEEGGA